MIRSLKPDRCGMQHWTTMRFCGMVSAFPRTSNFAGAAVMLLYERPDGASTVLRRLAAGDMFYIRQESGAYWQVCLLDGTVGWLENELCMINLPDVLPSIVYENPNAKASIFKTCSTTSALGGMSI